MSLPTATATRIIGCERRCGRIVIKIGYYRIPKEVRETKIAESTTKIAIETKGSTKVHSEIAKVGTKIEIYRARMGWG